MNRSLQLVVINLSFLCSDLCMPYRNVAMRRSDAAVPVKSISFDPWCDGVIV
jgi:hypothetical protein